MDLSSLFGPPTVYLSAAQLRTIAESLDEDGVVGVGIRNNGEMVATFVRVRANEEGGRFIPSESTADVENEVALDVNGGTYHTGTTDEEYESALNAASEINAPLVAAAKAAEAVLA